MFYTAHTFTHCPLPWHLRMSHVDYGFLVSLSLNMRWQNFKIRLVSPDGRVEADWLKIPANLQQRMLRGGIRKMSRMDADLPVQSFIKDL